MHARFRRTVAWSAVLAIVATAIGVGAELEPAGSHARLGRDEYLVADDPPTFDALLDEGFSIEFRFRVDADPAQSADHQLLLLKPESWSMLLTATGERLGERMPVDHHDEWLLAMTFRSRPAPLRWADGLMAAITTGSWHAARVDGYPGEPGIMQYDLYSWRPDGWIPWHTFGLGVADASTPLYVGNAPTRDIADSDSGCYGPIVPGHMYIDELRISSAPRGQDGLALRPKRDATTLALWRFDEGPGAPVYRDVSGRPALFLRRAALGVAPAGKLAATWAQLRSRAR